MALCGAVPVGAMNSSSKYNALARCIGDYLSDLEHSNYEENIEESQICLERYYKNIERVGWVFQRDMKKTLLFCIEHNHIAIMQQLLILWSNIIDINFVTQQDSPLCNIIMMEYAKNFYLPALIYTPDALGDSWYLLDGDNLQFVLMSYTRILRYRRDFLLFYTYFCDCFKNKVNVNIDDGKGVLSTILCKEYIEKKNADTTYEIFLEDFFKEFHNHILINGPINASESVFDVCVVKNSDTQEHIKNKKDLLVLLHKYFPQKLSFTKERLDKLHNCRWRFR